MRRHEQPNEQQRAALQAFATKHGRYWKATLANCWSNGRDERLPNGSLLRQVRNQLGPHWLCSASCDIKP